MENQTPSVPSCGADKGSLPAPCAPLAFPYVPIQDANPVRFSRMEALQTGTLFPGLDLPFRAKKTAAAVAEAARRTGVARI